MENVKNHECNTDGDNFFFNGNGEYFNVKETKGMSPMEKMAWMQEKNTMGVCHSCSICGRYMTIAVY